MLLCVWLRSANLTLTGNITLRERVLFIGTQFSILYTSMYSPAEAATPNQNISFLPVIMTTSSRMHGEFLRLLFLQAHCKTTAHFIATGLPSQQNRSDNVFWFKRVAFYMGLKSKVGLVAAKALALRINLNIQGCSEVAPPLHAPSHAPPLLPLLLSHNIPLPRVHY
jgi:hypothetical protein